MAKTRTKFPKVLVRGLDDKDDLVEILNARYIGPLSTELESGRRAVARDVSRRGRSAGGTAFYVSRLHSVEWAMHVADWLAQEYGRTATLDVKVDFDPAE